MKVCSREEADKLIEDESNLLKKDERNKNFLDYETLIINRGRVKDVENNTDEERKEIANLAITSGMTIDEVAKFSDVSPNSVSAYKHGATSEATYNNRDNPTGNYVKGLKDAISGAAQNKLMDAINALTDDKINSSKGRDIAGIARDMSSVVKNMNTDGPLIQNNKVIIYQPRMREEEDFDIIEVNE